MRTRSAALAIIGLALVASCGGGGNNGDVSGQVFGTWHCTVTGRPDWSFTVISLGENMVRHSWTDNVAGGGAQTAYVHSSELYLDDAAGEPWRNFLYVTNDAHDTLIALDEFPDNDGVGVPSYHCVR